MTTALLKAKCHHNVLKTGRAFSPSPVFRRLSSSIQHPRCRRRDQHWFPRAGEQGPDTTNFSLIAGSGNGKTESTIKDSDLAFVAKLVVASFVGAFLIKYGSLLVSLPFEPNAAIALAVVLGTPTVYSLYLLTQKQ